MERQFDLTLTNRWKATGFVFATIISVFILVGMIGVAFAHYPSAGFVGAVLMFVGLWFLPERIGKKVAYDLAAVTIDDNGLTVCYEAAGTTQRIEFADMASYSTYYGSDLTVRPHQGNALNLHLNYKLHPQGMSEMWALIAHFENVVAAYQRQHPNQPLIRNLGFFHRRGAVILLVVFGCLLAWLGWRAFQPFASESAWGGFLFVGLFFAIYVLVWRHNRRQLQ